MRFRDLFKSRGDTVFMFHGTSANNLQSILKNGLIPSEPGDGGSGRWATLGGIYLTSDFSYAAKAAKSAKGSAAVLIVAVRDGTGGPDEDVIEKALIASYTRALDAWGVDDAYDGDLDAYADAEEQRPKESGEEPFDRQKFYHEFWSHVVSNMSAICGQPIRSEPVIIQRAVNIALEFATDGDHEEDQHFFTQRSLEWQALKERLVKLYPRIRNREQHAKSALAIPHNIRVTKPIRVKGQNRIIAAVVQHGKGWRLAYGSIPDGVEIPSLI